MKMSTMIGALMPALAAVISLSRRAGAVTTIEETDTCFDVIKKVSTFDRQLGLRNLEKEGYLEIMNERKDTMENAVCAFNSNLKTDNNMFRCCATTDYVCDIFCPLKTLESTDGKGFELFGDAIKTTFATYSSGDHKKLHLIYTMRQIGAHIGSGHAFTVEQIPDSNGGDPTFRIYQSYVGAYSLRAWLEDTVLSGGYKEETNIGEIILNWITWCGVKMRSYAGEPCGKLDDEGGVRFYYEKAQQTLTKKINAATTSEDDKAAYTAFKELINRATQPKAVQAFQRSWEAFGKGKRISRSDFLQQFAEPLGMVTQFLKSANGSTKMSKEAFEAHERIFGTSMTAYYKGVAMDTLGPAISQYRFEVNVAALNPNDGKSVDEICQANGKVIMNQVKYPELPMCS